MIHTNKGASFVFFVLFAFAQLSNALTSIPLVVAHRGYSAVAPENTLPAFEMALKAGAQGFETDLQFTKDKRLVVLHDDTLNRTTNCTGYLADYTYAELADCDASYVDGHDFSAFRGTKIPLFSEVVAFAKNASMFVVMDYKSNETIGATLAEIVPPFGMVSRVFGSCWEPWQVVDMEENLPGAPKQLLTSGEVYAEDAFWESIIASGVNGFSIQLSNISSAFVYQAHSRLLSVAVWTVNDPVDMQTAVSYGVDAVLTDDVPTLVSVIKQMNAPAPPPTVVEDNMVIGVHKGVVVGVAFVVFVVTAVSVGAAVFFWKRSEYNKIREGTDHSFS